MRLQLTVNRHGLPSVHVLWTVKHPRPPLAVAGSSITVSQFLDQVNDVIPLESEDWGLEDYVVEVQGFECLHFSELGQILKEDDAVSIRPLQTNDLRVRRISGRHQISADGRHLIDGVAFGRPYLRKTARPAVKIPPRKRRRIEYDENDDSDREGEETHTNEQLLLRAGFNHVQEITAANVDDEEEDDHHAIESDEDLRVELEDLQNEAQSDAFPGRGIIPENRSQRESITGRRSRGSPQGLGLLKLVDENGHPFVGEYNNPLLDIYGSIDPTLSPTVVSKKRRSRNHDQSVVEDAGKGLSIQRSSEKARRASRRDSDTSVKSVHFEEGELPTPATIRESQSSDDGEDDDDFVPSEIDESDKENAEPSDAQTDLDNYRSKSSAKSSTSSSGSTSSDSPESSSLADSHQENSEETSSSGISSSDSSSDLESESEPDFIPFKSSRLKDNLGDVGGPEGKVKKAQESGGPADDTRPIVKYVSTNTPSAKYVPPGQGQSRTQKRNKRRQEQKSLAYFKLHGVLPQDATIRDFRTHQHLNPPEDVVQNESVDGAKSAPGDTIDAKRQELLAAINLGGSIDDATMHASDTNDRTLDQQKPDIEMDELEKQSNQSKEPFNHIHVDHQPVSDALADTKIAEKSPEDNAVESTVAQNSVLSPKETIEEKPDYSSQTRRSKLDVSGAKRMLFGSLGLRTPKTKEDELKTREKLMRDVRPVKHREVEERVETLEDIAADDSWKSKIDLRAVECCQDGITLSTPPFPFVQRWDPQQQRGYGNKSNRKRKGKKRKRNNSSYYDDNSYGYLQNEESYAVENLPPNDDTNLHTQERVQDLQEDTAPHESHHQSLEDSQAVDQQLLREFGEPSAPTLRDSGGPDIDLPGLPEDPSTCPSLIQEAAQRGTVIAFKSLEMSAGTNWQPMISEYKTAIINKVMENGILQLTLASRDRRDMQIEYDRETGERVYSRFEMPGYDEGNDDNNVEIAFDELISPILLRAAQDQFTPKKEGIAHGAGHPPSVASVYETINGNINGSGMHLNGAGDRLIEPNRESREEISELIRDAGWRSSLRSGLNGDLLSREDSRVHEKTSKPDETTLSAAPSPRFNGFSSSPIVNVRSSPPVAREQSPKRPHASGTEIAESVPRLESPLGSHTSNIKNAIEYPNLPLVGDDSELLNEEAQNRSDPLFDHQDLSQDLVSEDVDQSPAWNQNPQTKDDRVNSPSKSPGRSHHVTESEEEFPEPFSQAWDDRIFQERNIKSEFSQDRAISPPSYWAPKAIGTRASSQRESNQSWKPDGEWSTFEGDEEEDDVSTPRPSQKQRSSHIVDLTMSSDGANPSQQVDEDDSYRLPKGPGWVKKTKFSRESSATTKGKVRKVKSRQR